MIKIVTYIFIGLVVMINVTSISAPASASETTAAPLDTFTFINFSKQMELVKQDNYYRIKNTQQRVILANRLIVKTTKGISSHWLVQQHTEVIKATLLFEASQNNYFLLVIKDQNLLPVVLKDFQQMKEVEWVQPDLLQLGSQSLAKDKLRLNHQSKQTLAEKKISDAKIASRRANRKERRKANKALKEKNPSPYIALLNLKNFWKKTKGKGVKIAIIDDGFNLKHEDLQHIKPIFSYDSDLKKVTSSPKQLRDKHGTKVAGILFAEHNQIGIDGIAPQAELIALRQADTWTSNTLLSFQLANLAGASIINCSWNSHWLMQPIKEVIDDLAEHGRNGKGTAVIIAAGNGARHILPNSLESSIESAIVVGAVNSQYERLKSSNYGDMVDLEVYGGRAQTTLVTGQYGNFSTTSLAASIVSGLSGLVLSQYPDMTLDELIVELEQITTQQFTAKN